MALPIPQYIQIADIQDINIKYLWDDWDVEATDMPLDKVLQKRFGAISQRAVATFTIGTAEWVVYRFGTLSNDPVPNQCLEAAWAQIVDFCYSFYEDIRQDQWNGPIRGPIGIALRRVGFAIQQAELGHDPAWRAGRISNLAEHIITNPTPYKDWRERVLTRLEKLYPIDSNETLGEVIPREALDPDFDFKVEETDSLINQFLSQLNHDQNPFLNSPQKMLSLGFKGIPYTFNIKDERKNRLEW